MIFRNAVKNENLPFVVRYIPDWYKTQGTCDKAILENDVTLKSVLECYKNHSKCNKAVDNYENSLEFVTNSYKT